MRVADTPDVSGGITAESIKVTEWKVTEGFHKRVSASQRDFVTAQGNQAAIRKPWKSLAAVAFGLLPSVPGLAQAQYSFFTIDVPGATRTARRVRQSW